jgi:hypothetical protein
VRRQWSKFSAEKSDFVVRPLPEGRRINYSYVAKVGFSPTYTHAWDQCYDFGTIFAEKFREKNLD